MSSYLKKSIPYEVSPALEINFNIYILGSSFLSSKMLLCLRRVHTLVATGRMAKQEKHSQYMVCTRTKTSDIYED